MVDNSKAPKCWKIDEPRPNDKHSSMVYPPKQIALEKAWDAVENRQDKADVNKPQAKPDAKTERADAAPAGPASISELARSLNYNIDNIFEWIYSNVDFCPIWGSNKGDIGTLIDRIGSSFDQSNLMVSLLQACDSAVHTLYNAQYALGYIQLTAAEIENFLGTNDSTVATTTEQMLEAAFIPYTANYTGGVLQNVVIAHVWVQATIGGTLYVFDPTYKIFSYTTGINLSPIINYNASALTTAAQSGATITSDSIQNFNSSNVVGDFTTYGTNLLNWIQTNEFAGSMDSIIGGRAIQPWTAGPVRQTSVPNQYGGAPLIESTIPLANCSGLRIQIPGASQSMDVTFTSAFIYGQRLSLEFVAGGYVEIFLNGVYYGYADGYSTPDMLAQVTFTVYHPWAAGLSWQQYIITNEFSIYNVSNAWGPSSQAMVDHHRWLMQTYVASGNASSSELVLGEALASYFFMNSAQWSQIQQIYDQVGSCQHLMYHFIGITGYNTYQQGPYFDLQGIILAVQSTVGDSITAANVLYASQIVGNGFEAGIIQQVALAESVVGVNTQRMLDVANSGHQLIYDANSTNWSTIRAGLTSTWSSAALSQIDSFISGSGTRAIIHNNGSTTIGSYHGGGYYLYQNYMTNQFIEGELTGTISGGAGSQPVSTAQAVTGIANTSDSTQTNGNVGKEPTSPDPVGLSSGNAYYNRTDFSVGSSDFPYSLQFSRSYNSDNLFTTGPLGFAWTHNFMTTAMPGSNALRVCGEFSPKEAAASIAHAFVMIQLALSNSPTLTALLIASKSTLWLMDQMTNNSVTVNDGGDSREYVLLVDGTTYNPAPGYVDKLTVSGGAYTLTNPQQQKWNFNSLGNLATYVDPAGVTLTYNYNTSHQLSSVSNGLGRTLSLTYSGSHLGSVSDGNGRSIGFYFDINGNLSVFQDTIGNLINYGYGPIPYKLTQIILPGNYGFPAVTNAYDTLGRVSSQTILLKVNASGIQQSATTNFYIAGSRSEMIDPLGNNHIMYFNSFGSLTRDINALSQETDYSYDGLNRVTHITSPESNSIGFTYDNYNNVLTKTWTPKTGSGLSNVVQTFTYDTVWHKLATFQDGLGNTKYFSYDPTYGVLTQINSPSITASSVTTITISGAPPSGSSPQTIRVNGNAAIYPSGTSDTNSTIASGLSSQINGLAIPGVSAVPSGTQQILLTAPIGTTLTATGLGGVTITNAIFNNAFFTYNMRGQLLTSTDPTGLVTNFAYDSSTEKLLTSKIDYGSGSHLNLQTSFGYDAPGNVTSITDPRNYTTSFLFDTERRLAQRTETTPFNYITNWNYDVKSNLTSMSQQTGVAELPNQTWSYNYHDSSSNVCTLLFSVADPENNATTRTYDLNNNLHTSTDAQGREWQWSYDALNRITTVTDPLLNTSQTRTYTINGYLYTIKDANSNTTTLTYDGLDRLSQRQYPDTTYEANTYDANNNVLTLQTRLGTGSANTITNTYDVLNRLSTRQPGSLPLQTMTYDLAGRLTQVSTPVVSGDPSSGNFGYSYDTAGRLLVQTMPNSNTVTYQLDQNGNRTQLTWPDGVYVNYVYDQLNRLTSIKYNLTNIGVGFTYDQLSRRTGTNYYASSPTIPVSTTTYEYALNNDLTSLDHVFNGSSVSFNYCHNLVHQLTSVSVNDNSFLWEPSASSTVSYGTANDLNQYPSVGGTSYSYNNNGCLTAGPLTSTTFDMLNRLTQAVSGSNTNNYLIDPLNRQAQKNANGTKTDFLYDGNQLIATYDDSTGALINRYIPSDNIDEVFLYINGGTGTYLYRDRQGTVIAESNLSGAVANKFTYSPFGETTSISASGFGYTGQRYDAEVGLYNYKARYYAPSIGRFLQPDPLGYAAGDMNLYSYVGNDALNLTDPLGLEAGLGNNKVKQTTSAMLTPYFAGAVTPVLSADSSSILKGQVSINQPPQFYEGTTEGLPRPEWNPGYTSMADYLSDLKSLDLTPKQQSTYLKQLAAIQVLFNIPNYSITPSSLPTAPAYDPGVSNNLSTGASSPVYQNNNTAIPGSPAEGAARDLLLKPLGGP